MISDRPLRLVVCALLIASAVLFAIGVAIERHETHTEGRGSPAAQLPTPLLLADADQGKGETTIGATTPQSGETTARHERREKTRRSAHETPTERSHETKNERSHENGRESAHESPAQLAREHRNERIFGINPESTPLVAAVVAASLALALALWLRPTLLITATIIIIGLGAGAFDIREVLHQIDESRTNLIVIASIVALLHLAAGIGAAILTRRLLTNREPLPEHAPAAS